MPTWNRDDFEVADSASGITADSIESHPDAALQGYRWGDIQKGLVAYYPMEQGQSTHLHDAARDNHAHITGATWTTGNIGSQALNFDGTDDYALTNDNIDIVGKSHTILQWVRIDTVPSTTDTIYTQSDSRNTAWIDGSVLRVHAIDSGGTLHYGDTTFSPSAGTWYLIGQRFYGDTTEINSIIDTSISGDLTSSASRTVADLPMYIAQNSGGAGYADITLDSMYIYDRVLSDAEIRSIYNLTAPIGKVSLEDPRDGLVSEWKLDGNATDSVGSNDGTVNGATFETAYDGQGASFDGIDDNIKTPLSPVPSTPTFSAWIKPDTFGDGNGYETKVVTTGSTDNLSLGVSPSGEIRSNLYNSSTQVSYTATGPSLSSGEWVFVLASYDGTNLRLYMNGVLCDTVNAGITFEGSSADFTIGNHNSAARHFDGLIDEVRVYNRSLSPVEVEHLYHLGRLRINRKKVI